ncbi:organic solvent ABC transporter permease [Marinobacter salinisoli]|uniref:Organic solvent ABC transporter permease n=1 Tax=Marinobacter salinisoli TaxID=2769486 RepID=A0ABX7MPE8_9GAMM|nr:organic solvent ABC transporter permease [Marinobacter salinisoli]QSP94119.1 organic solvent ABC transporter permease [Marinobacter salinisoli]
MRFVRLNLFSLTLVSTLLLAGCLDVNSSDEAKDDRSVGQLNFHGISGLSYQTQSQSGEVTEEGKFKYYPGETLTFWVGDLRIAQDVPAQEFVTLMEFLPEVRAQLTNAAADETGLTTHKITEQALLENSAQQNLIRFILALNWTSELPRGQRIDIRQRVIDQLNAILPTVEGGVDFNIPQNEFANRDSENLSPANQIISQICFHPEDDERCDTPPTLAEIENADPVPDDPTLIEEDKIYKEDLQAKRSRILLAKRYVDQIKLDAAKSYMTGELNGITTVISNRYYLDAYVANHLASDTDIKTIKIRPIDGSADISDLDALSTRPNDVVLHSTSWQEAEVEYFVAGNPEGESELLVSFRPEDTYRWIKKQLRVIIE